MLIARLTMVNVRQEFDWDGEEKPGANICLTTKLRIRLTDPDKNPIPYARCRIADEPESIYDCDEFGIVEIPVKDRGKTSIDIEWERSESANDNTELRFFWKNTLRLNVDSQNDPPCETRLTHLGFYGNTLAEQVNEYQKYFNRDPTGNINDIRDELVEWHDGGNYPGFEDTAADSEFFNSDESATGPVENDDETVAKNVKIILADYDLNAYGSMKCTVTSLDESLVYFSDYTNSDGSIEFEKPSIATIKVKVFLTDQVNADSREWQFKMVDELPSIATSAGILNRLKNLGYYSKNVEDPWGQEQQAALMWFQNDFGLSETGTYNEETGAKLLEIYGS